MHHAEMRERIARLTPTFACWDLLEFAALTRPSGISLDQIARQIGRAPDDALPAVAHFVAGYVLRETHPSSGRYTFDPPTDVATDIETLIDALADPAERLWAVTAVLQMDNDRSGMAADEGMVSAGEVAR